MAEETKDQAQTGDPQVTEQVTKPEPSEKKAELPKSGFFTGSKMTDWIKDRGLEDEEPKVEPPAKVEPKEEPCPPGSPCAEAAEKKAAAQQASKATETRKPIDVLTVDGREYPVYTQEDYKKLAQTGLHATQMRQKDAEWEKDLRATEDRLMTVGKDIKELTNHLKAGKPLAPVIESQEARKAKLDQILDDEGVSPEFKEELLSLKNEVIDLRGKLSVTGQEQKEERVRKAADLLKNTIEKVQKENPYDNIVDEESGVNITEKAFVGLFGTKLSEDRLLQRQNPQHQMRSVQELMQETAQDLNKISKFYEAKFSDNTQGNTLASIQDFKNKYPDLAKEYEEQTVAAYLDEQDKTAPIARTTVRDEAREATRMKKKGKGGLAEQLVRAAEDGILGDAQDEIIERMSKNQ